MAKCTIDGRVVEFNPGENMIEVAKKAGVEIPFFCYHPGLTVVAQCRMCAVEIEKMPKLQTACSTPLAEGMVISTQSERVKQNQKSVMEFLLINHPLDCPICDKAGECDLQDQSFKFGSDEMRTSEDRRTYMDLDMGPVIKKNMNRCIHCTRCIRFGDEVAEIREMVAVQRGNNTEITTIDGRPLETDYAGNYSDICPTGSLTLKDFRFQKRAWMLKKTATICEGCSKGCNIELQHEKNVIYRTIPRENQHINKWWMCDEGRFNYQYVNSKSRVSQPLLEGQVQEWSQVFDGVKKLTKGKKLQILVGTDHTQEEASLLLSMLPKVFSQSTIGHFGTTGVKTSAQDAPADTLLKRTSKTANLNGFEKLGYRPYDENEVAEVTLLIRSGRAELPKQLKAKNIIGIGVFSDQEAKEFKAVLPSLSFAEKSGTIYNHEGREQKFQAALYPVGSSKPLEEIFTALSQTAKGEVA